VSVTIDYVAPFLQYAFPMPADHPSDSFYLQPLEHPSKDLCHSTILVGHATLHLKKQLCSYVNVYVKKQEWWVTVAIRVISKNLKRGLPSEAVKVLLE